MSEILLRTKLFVPPLLLNLVPRARLAERLTQGLQQGAKLTLISAPAGFGKTTLVTLWVQATRNASPPTHFAWLSLDEKDSDPARFLAYVVTALCQLEGVQATLGEAALDMLQSPQPPPAELILTSLINEISTCPDRMVLILDDYHLIDSALVDEALSFLIERLPPQLHLVIATRIDPNLPLARLRARGHLTELRAIDLRLTSAEVAVFLNDVMGLNLSGDDVAALESRTEGWFAGLQLAALALQGHRSVQGKMDASSFIKSFAGSHRYVLDYLLEEVLGQQPEEIQAFLLRTAVLDRLTGPLCDALTGENGGQAVLETLDRANLFIVPLDEERRWYRYHALFADLLRQRLRQKHAEMRPALYQRASAWCTDHGFAEEAIGYALRAKDLERATVLIEEQAETICHCGEQTELRQWLAELPLEWVFSKPQLCLCHAWNLFMDGRQDAADASLKAAEEALGLITIPVISASPIEGVPSPAVERAELRRRVATIRRFVASYQSDAPEIIKRADQVLEQLPEQDATWRSTAFVAAGDAYTLMGDLASAHRVRLDALEASKRTGSVHMILIASLKLAMTMMEQGHFAQAVELCQRQLQLANESGLSETGVAGWFISIWGWILAELNDLEGALHKAREGVALAGQSSDVEMLGWSYLTLARVLLSSGELDTASQVVQKLADSLRMSTVPPWIADMMAAWQARIWLAQNRLEATSRWVEARGLDFEVGPTYAGGSGCGALARLLIAQGRHADAISLLQRATEKTMSGGHTARTIEYLILKSLAFEAEGDRGQAIDRLEHALTVAEPGGFIRIFVDEGPPLARLLVDADSRGARPGYVRQLLAAFAGAVPVLAEPSDIQAAEMELIEPPSERELEVLQLISEGLTNREIASRLFLSLNTVKAHTRNIYGKLDAHSRTQAVAKARALGLLPSL